MAGRSTNLALAGLLAIAVVTGVVSYGIGTTPVRVALMLHAVASVGIVVLVPWKTPVVRRGLRRVREGRWLSIALAVLVIATIFTGIAHSVLGATSLGPVTVMQAHVSTAILAMVAAVAHMLQRPQRLRAADLSRRTFLRAGGLAAAAVAGWAVIEGGAVAARLPGATRRFTGSHERGTYDPGAMPVTSWLNDTVPQNRPGRITVLKDGQVVEIETSDLDAFDDRVTATLDCTGGWYATQMWSGARLDRLVEPTAGSIRVISATGYERRFPAAALEHLLLATRAGGKPLSPGHGAPVRLVAPGRRGFWWVKWVSEIVVDDRPAWWQPPVPLT